ncbi:MAG TPA: hypothetical protein VG652_01395 [Gaiellaceae bacterium]|nr:hypothetical protein [Gaiellaceae bacterium]
MAVLAVALLSTSVPTAKAHPAKAIGPLKVCAYVTVNDSTPTENIKVLETGAAGFKGSFVLKGVAANVTTHFVVRKNGTAFTSFNGTTVGAEKVTVTLGAKTRVLHLTIPVGTNIRQQAGCVPH